MHSALGLGVKRSAISSSLSNLNVRVPLDDRILGHPVFFDCLEKREATASPNSLLPSELANDFAADPSSQRTPDLTVDIRADGSCRSVGQSHIDDPGMVTARSNRRIRRLSDARSFVARVEIGIVGDSAVGKGNTGIRRERCGETTLMDRPITPFRMSRVVVEIGAVFRFARKSCDD